MFASDCVGYAAATGYYAGRHAANFALGNPQTFLNETQIELERQRIRSLVNNKRGINWKELNLTITRIMQNYCCEIKSKQLLNIGLQLLDDLETKEITRLYSRNPHELIRSLEVINVLTNAKLIINSCLVREASSKNLHFTRSDYPEMDPPEWHKFITIKLENNRVKVVPLPIDYYGSLKENYEMYNKEYINQRRIS